MKINRVIVTLLVTLIYTVVLPRVPWLADRAVSATVVLVVMLGAWAIQQRAYTDAWIGVSIALALAVAKVWFGDTDELLLVLVTCAILAYGYLSFALLIGPWSRFFRPRFVRLMKHRRHVGVTGLLLAQTHVSIVFVGYYGDQIPSALSIAPNVFGATTLYIMDLMGFTSWDFATKKITLPWWNVIHTTGLFGYLGLLAYVWNRAGLAGWEKGVLVAFALYWLWQSPWRVQWLAHRTPNGWRQLHLLVYAAYAAIIIHVWSGVVSQRPLIIQTVFLLPAVLVVGSHSVGLAMKHRQMKARRMQQPPAVPPPIPPPPTDHGTP